MRHSQSSRGRFGGTIQCQLFDLVIREQGTQFFQSRYALSLNSIGQGQDRTLTVVQIGIDSSPVREVPGANTENGIQLIKENVGSRRQSPTTEQKTGTGRASRRLGRTRRYLCATQAAQDWNFVVFQLVTNMRLSLRA